MLTVVEEMGNDGPRWWQDAASIVICDIFNNSSLEKIVRHLDELEEIGKKNEKNAKKLSIPAGGPDVQESEKFLNSHFDGMLNNYKFFNSDYAYWVDEWRQLGCLAAAAGIKNGNFLAISPDPGSGHQHPENFKKTANSASVEFDSWMIRDTILETLIRKQRDYGHENISRFGRFGLLVRTHDKLARLRNLQATQNSPENESIIDTYTDIVGYSAIGMMLERNWFSLNLKIEF